MPDGKRKALCLEAPSAHASASSSLLSLHANPRSSGPLTTVAGVGALDLPPELSPSSRIFLSCSLRERGGRGHHWSWEGWLLATMGLPWLLSSQGEIRKRKVPALGPIKCGPALSEGQQSLGRERNREGREIRK